MYYLYGKINRGHGIWPLFGGCPLLGESVIRGFTVYFIDNVCYDVLYRKVVKISHGSGLSIYTSVKPVLIHFACVTSSPETMSGLPRTLV